MVLFSSLISPIIRAWFSLSIFQPLQLRILCLFFTWSPFSAQPRTEDLSGNIHAPPMPLVLAAARASRNLSRWLLQRKSLRRSRIHRTTRRRTCSYVHFQTYVYRSVIISVNRFTRRLCAKKLVSVAPRSKETVYLSLKLQQILAIDAKSPTTISVQKRHDKNERSPMGNNLHD